MTPQQYMAACQTLHEELTAVAQRTQSMAKTRSADYANPAFAAIMVKQNDLLSKLDQLDKEAKKAGLFP